MSAYTTQEYKAIGWYADNNNLKIQISRRPTMYFIARDGGEEVKVGLHILEQIA